MARKILYIFLLAFILADTGYSFLQFYNTPFDGDMAGGIVPASDVKNVLESPFGLKAITNDINYPNPNRFFSHYIFFNYFNLAPDFLNNFFGRVDSAYLSCAVAKLLIQLLIILLLAIAINGSKKISSLNYVLSAALIVPFFQTNGYVGYMGIIDTSTTYTFFYALPCAFILIYFIPLYLKVHYRIAFADRLIVKIIWILFSFIVCLSGPLNPGIGLIISFLILFGSIQRNYVKSSQNGMLKKLWKSIGSIPGYYYIYLIPISIVAFYSLFLGRYNSIDTQNKMPLTEIYARLPAGIYYQLTQKLGLPVLIVATVINILIIRNKKWQGGEKILVFFRWILIFALIYILLLPFGGYRPYRENILRYDTFMPVTIAIIFIFVYSSINIFKNTSKRLRTLYIFFIITIAFIFTNADRPGFNKNDCEKSDIYVIAESPDSIVTLNNDCKVLSWETIIAPEKSELNAELLMLWGITDIKKKYYYKTR